MYDIYMIIWFYFNRFSLSARSCLG